MVYWPVGRLENDLCPPFTSWKLSFKLAPPLAEKLNCPSPPMAIFLTVRLPFCRVLVNVQVTFSPGPRLTVAERAPGLPVLFVPPKHCTSVSVQPGVALSVKV